jgi:hypothetical protein
MVSKEALKKILSAGRRLSSDEYHKHCQRNNVKTFYFFCVRLSSGTSNVAASSTELNDFILAELKRRHIVVSTGFNPQSHFGKSWTDWIGPATKETNFRDEYCDVLERSEHDPYSYQIRTEYLGLVKEILAELQNQT